MSSVEEGKESAEFCAELVRSHDFARYASTLFVPAAQRRALLAIYAFNVEISRVHEQVSQPLPGEIRLQWWREVLNGERSGEAAAHPIAAALTISLQENSLSAAPLLGLIEARSFDLYDDPRPSVAAFEAYA